jgi:hypothetical protein
MKTFLISLLIAISLAGSMAAAANVYGWHSTPGIWLFLLNLPGTGVAAAAISRVAPNGESDSTLYLISVPVNCAFYCLLVKGLMLVKRKFSN